MHGVVKKIAAEFKSELVKLYGEELGALILYGSHARGESDADSDIDFAVILKNDPVKSSTEIIKISPVSSEIGLRYSELISVFPLSSHRFETSQIPVLQEIRKEGILI